MQVVWKRGKQSGGEGRSRGGWWVAGWMVGRWRVEEEERSEERRGEGGWCGMVEGKENIFLFALIGAPTKTDMWMCRGQVGAVGGECGV